MDALEIARRLIGYHSVSDASSREIADFVSNVLADAGFAVRQQTYLVGLKDKVEKVNVIAQKGSGDVPELAFSGHLDTVPYESDKWVSDPLKLTERDGLLYGRGACDMKGFIGLAMAIGTRIPARELRRPFALLFTSDEEVGCVGARNLVKDHGLVAKNIVIGEPTGLVPFNLHKGYVYARITLEGTDGHSSEPDKGRNALMRAVPTVLQRLNEIEREFRNIRDPRFEVPFPTLNVGTMHTGKGAAKNVIAKECFIELDIRPLPGQDVDEVVRAVREYVAPNREINGIKVKVDLVRTPSPPFETPENAAIVKALETVFETKAASTSFNTEGGILNRSGSQCVICGLGSIQQAHKPNEYVDARFFSEDTERRYERLVRMFCCSETEK